MVARKSETGRVRRGLVAVYVTCLLCLLGIAGQAWRAWRVERRGIAHARQGDVELQMGTNVALEQYSSDALARTLDDIASSGLVWVRQRFPWRQIEPEAGVYDWALWDVLVAETQARGLGLIAVLDDPPEWALRRDAYPLPCVPPCETDAYARFVSAFAQRYGEVIDHYQVWDEPNLSRSWGGGHAAPCGYAVLLETAYKAIHAADPAAQVLGGGLAPTQAPGPADLNDLLYLRQLYAAGGGTYFDLLAIKPYGFWSGPWDRRVDPDVLNYSRVVAVREIMRAAGDGDKPVWAVAWGWNALPTDWTGDRAPWGTDAPDMQGTRIAGAVVRARAEWPWLDVLCWAEYQPHAEETDPRWGFALRDPEGAPTPLYNAIRIAIGRSTAPNHTHYPAGRPVLYLATLLLSSVPITILLWRRLDCSQALRQLWKWWAGRGPGVHLLAVLALAVLYALTTRPEWMCVELALACAVFYVHPRWALLGAVGCIPFFYAAKPVGSLLVPPSETLLLLALVVAVLRWARKGARPSPARHLVPLDVVWAAWVVWGAVSLVGAPDLAFAGREWRLCVLDPALLYVLIRLQRFRGVGRKTSLLAAWLLSGGIVALVAIVQWVAGTLVPAGSVGRAMGVYYSPNHLALYLVRVWPVPLALVLCADLARRRRRWLWGLVVVLGAALYLTYSRGAWLLGVPAALATVGWCYRRHLRWWMVACGLVVLLLVTSNVFLGRSALGTGLLDEVRIPVWQSTLEMIASHPWIGVGLDGFRFVYPRYMRVEAWTEPLLYHPHNAWLDAAVRLGLPGLALFAALVVLCVSGTARWSSGAHGLRKAIAVACLASLLAGLSHGLVDSGYFLPDLAWSLALVAGIVMSGLDSRSRRG